jgi:AraC-like DNA-binding protein
LGAPASELRRTAFASASVIPIQCPCCPKGQYQSDVCRGRFRCEPLMARSQLGLLQMFNCNGTPSVVLTLSKRMGNRELVEQAERLALANFQTPLDIPTLCRALAVSERTLRKAFQKNRGLPPCRRIRMLRLSGARRGLLSACGGCVTVTEIATSFGFVELGRFSVEYRKMFGESPSETLSRRSVTHRCRSASHDRVGTVGSGISEMSSL